MTPQNYTLTVSPTFANAPDWNDHVRRNDPNTACDGSETGLNPCIHGGERRKVVTIDTSCSGLVITDTLGAFEWYCSVDNGVATFYSSIKYGKGLRNLVSATGWLTNSVSISGSVHTYSNPSSVWWNNPVNLITTNNASVVNLTTVSAINIITTDITSAGFHINANKAALVTLPNKVIDWNNSSACNLNDTTGEPSGCSSYRSQIMAGGQNFLWIEAALLNSAATRAHFGVYFRLVKHSRIHRTGVSNTATVTANGAGIMLYLSDSNFISDSRVANNDLYGLMLSSSNNNRVSFFTTYNNGSKPVYVYGSVNNTLVGITSTSNAQGVWLENGSYNRLVNTTHVNSSGNGISVYSSANATVHNAVIANINTGYGLTVLLSANYTTLSQIAIYSTSNSEINTSSSYNKYTGNLVLETGAACLGGTNKGITGSCTPEGASDQTLFTNLNLTSSFKGPRTADSVNTSHVAGQATYSSIADWLGFECDFRAWGILGSFPGPTVAARCSSGTCGIWDWTLAATDNFIRNRTDTYSSQNAAPTGGNCSDSVRGDVSLVSNIGCSIPGYSSSGACTTASGTWGVTQTYLKNAFEVLDDTVGDEDGLCETNELCVYSPNFGSYQGHGTFNKCQFNAGSGLTGISIYQAADNGT